MGFLGAVLSWLSGGALGRILDTVDRRIDVEANKDKIRGDVIREHMRTRAGWMRAGGFWTLLLFAIPTAFHFAAVVVYSVFWCADCAYPKDWTIAALPAPMSQWQGWVVLACIGGLSLFSLKR